MFDILPPELVLKVFSYIFLTGTVPLEFERTVDLMRHKKPTLGDSFRRDPRYLAYRSKQANKNASTVWHDDIEHAFHQSMLYLSRKMRELTLLRKALRWVNEYQLKINGTRPTHSNEIISAMMFELTGCWRSRKQVAAHLQFLKNLAHEVGDDSHSRMQTVNGNENSCQDFLS